MLYFEHNQVGIVCTQYYIFLQSKNTWERRILIIESCEKKRPQILLFYIFGF